MPLPLQARLAAAWRAAANSWFTGAVLLPFTVTRLAWLLVAAFAQATFLPNPTYLKYAQQGGQLTRVWLLDIFSRWDARFYLSIIRDGYQASPDLTTQYSNTAFFPLYPYLVKGIGWLGVPLPTGVILLTGLVLSNVCFLAAAALLYRLAVERLGLGEAAARRALALLMVFPTSFYFSCFYTESLFLLLSLGALYAGLDRRWWLAGICAALAVLTRNQGLVVVAALAFLYLEQRGWRLKAVRWDALWLALAPAALLAHLYSLWRITGSFFAPYQAVQAWGRGQYGLLEGLRLQLEAPALDVYKLDAVLSLLFLGCGVYLLRRTPRVWGVYTLLMCLMPLSSGLLISMGRYLVVVFPVFLLLGEKLERRGAYDLARALFFALQVVYFAGWVNYYWID